MSNLRLDAKQATQFVEQIFNGYGFSKRNSSLIAASLIDADLRGITSHGIQRLSMYDRKIQAKYIVPDAIWRIINQTETSLLVDANQTMGQLVSIFTMNEIIEKAQSHGIAVGVVKNSNHFGAAGYYARMAAKKGLIGIAATNSNPLLVPPNAREPFLGSNPLAFAFPTKKDPFVFDAATSTVSLGKIEVLLKNNQKIPGEWAVDGNYQQQNDPQTVLDDLSRDNRIGGILPLGGLREDNSNYKGLGNAMIIECLTAILAQSSISADLGNKNHDLSHFFLALDPSLFGSLDETENNLSQMLTRMRHMSHLSEEPITLPGDKEIHAYEENQVKGIAVDQRTFDEVNVIANRLDVPNLRSFDAVKG